MKPVFIIGLLLCFLAGCRPSLSEETVTSFQDPSPLVAVDSLMWSQPDSAFALLQEHFDPDSPYAQLLLSELLYKNDYTQTNRSELLRIVDRFDSTPFLSARAHYINGVGYYENDSVVEACREYLKALEIMENHYREKELVGHKAKFMALTYHRLGGLFCSQFMPEPAISCYKEAQLYCIKEPTSKNGVSNNYYRIGMQYDIIGRQDSALYYYEKALEHLADTDNLIYRNINTNKALLYYQMRGDSDLAIKNLKNVAEKCADESERLKRYLAVGAVYFEKGCLDSARYYLEPVFENGESETSRIQAAEYLCRIYDSVVDSEKTNDCVLFLAEHKKPEGAGKALTSKLENMFHSYFRRKNERKADEERTCFIRKIVGITVPLVILVAVVIAFWVKQKGNRLLRKQRVEAEEKLKAREELLKTQQSALSDRLRQKSLEVFELKGQILHQMEGRGQDKAVCSFADEPICRLIMDRVKEGRFLSSMECSFYKDYALNKEQISELRNAADRHFNQFTLRISVAYPKLTRNDLDYCCLYLLGLTDADIAALMQRAYNTVNERNSKLRKIFHSKNALPITLKAIANESV